MFYKFKNPYLDSSFDNKTVFNLRVILFSQGINIKDGHYGYSIYKGNLNLLDAEDSFSSSIATEISIYNLFPSCIPEDMRYDKELDKLVPNILEKNEIPDFMGQIFDFSKLSDAYLNSGFRKLSNNEAINERENGFVKADLGKIDFTLVDPYAYRDLAKQLTIGVKKYSRDNWQKGDILSYLAALERHINDVRIALEEDDIEKLIDDTEVNQGGALMFNSMAIHYFIRQILERRKKC